MEKKHRGCSENPGWLPGRRVGLTDQLLTKEEWKVKCLSILENRVSVGGKGRASKTDLMGKSLIQSENGKLAGVEQVR